MKSTLVIMAANVFCAGLMAVMFAVSRDPVNVVLGLFNVVAALVMVAVYRIERPATHTTEEGE